jgi:hypothetical protein
VKQQVDRYYHLQEEIRKAKSSGDWRRALDYALEGVAVIPALVQETKREYGRFDITESVALDTAGELLALHEDVEALEEIRQLLIGIRGVKSWAKEIADQITHVGDIRAVLNAIAATPGVLQSELRAKLGPAGQFVSGICHSLERVGRIRREKKGRSYRLYPA